MKNKNNIEKFFYQQEFSVFEIILLIMAIVFLIVATFIQGGGPIGLSALLICTVIFFVCRSSKVKDTEVEQTLKKIMQNNNISCSDNTIKCYELKSTITKKRKDGKIISPKYYITDIAFTSECTIFTVYTIDLISQSVKKETYCTNSDKRITLTEEAIKCNSGLVKMTYLKIDNEYLIPVTSNDYKSSQLLQKIFDRHQ